MRGFEVYKLCVNVKIERKWILGGNKVEGDSYCFFEYEDIRNY